MHRGRHTLTQGRRELSICSALVASGVVCCGNGDLVTNPTPVVRSGGQPTRRCVRPWEVYTGVRRDGDTFPNVVGISPHVCVRPWGNNTSVRRDGNQFPNVVVICPHVCARPCGKNTSVRRDGNQLPNAVGICPHVCVRPWRGWNSTARVCATAGSTYECALRWGIFPNVLGICPHVCMRPWEVYTSVRRDGNQFPNVV